MKYIVYLGFVSLLLLSCTKISNQNKEEVESKLVFERQGISFEYPSNWEITEDEDYGGEGFHLSLSKKENLQIGMLTITAFNGVNEISEVYMNSLIKGLEDQVIYKNLQITSHEKYTYGSYEATGIEYTAEVVGDKVQGTICVILSGNKAVNIMKQEDADDHTTNKTQFDMMEQSFKILGEK